MASIRIFLLLLLGIALTGCGRFVAARIAQAPNTYPTWLAPVAPVQLSFAEALLTNVPAEYLEVAAPPARLRYRVMEPAHYQFKSWRSNVVESGHSRLLVGFSARLPAQTNGWSTQPRGTVFLLHGYGVGMFAMLPWSLNLAQHGWRCVLVDLRGHGKSTGDKIYYGPQESADLRQLLDQLTRDGRITPPVTVVGESYGAAVALRWSTEDDRIKRVVAMTPYGSLSNAVLNICHEYSRWLPDGLIRAGLKDLPRTLGVAPEELDTRTIMQRSPCDTFFIAGAQDRITPPEVVLELFAATTRQRQMLTVADATHEAAPYFFTDLEAPVVEWLNATERASAPAGD